MALAEINKARLEISAQKAAIEEFYSRIQRETKIDINDLVELIRPKVIHELANSYSFTGGVLAFTAQECPNGWSEYAPAYGRFIRGIDNSGTGIDPDGKRPAGNLQAEQLKAHSHAANMEVGAEPTSGRAQANEAAGAHGRHGVSYMSNGLVNPTGGVETRPINVALLFCEKL